MPSYVGTKLKVVDHTVDLSLLYLKEGALVLVSNECNNIKCLYSRTLPGDLEFTTYPDEFQHHDIIHITKEDGFCKVFFDREDQERDCAQLDNQNGLKKVYYNPNGEERLNF
jgi:hypothetical protein